MLLEKSRQDMEKSRQDMLQMKARCLIEYFRISLTLFLGQETEVQQYMASLGEAERIDCFLLAYNFYFFYIKLFFKDIDWSFFFKTQRLKQMIFRHKDFKKFISVAQKDTYQVLCSSMGVHKLEKKDFKELKELIPRSALPVFEEKEAWMNLISFVENNFDKLEDEKIKLKNNKLL